MYDEFLLKCLRNKFWEVAPLESKLKDKDLKMGPLRGYFSGAHKLQEKTSLLFWEITQLSHLTSELLRIIICIHMTPDFKYLQTQVAVIVLLTQVGAQINGIKILT